MVKGSLPVLVLAKTKPRRLKPALPGRQARNFHHRPDFHGSPTASRDSPSNPDGLIEVFGVYQEVPAELFTGLPERAVGHQPLVVAHADAGRRRGRMERPSAQILPALAELDGELRGFLITLSPVGLAQPVFIQVDQQHVFHACPLYVDRTARPQIDIYTKKFIQLRMP